jgi:hypothetical protein
MAETSIRNVAPRARRPGSGPLDTYGARLTAVALLAIPVAAYLWLTGPGNPEKSSTASGALASVLNPRGLFQEEGRSFLPAPVVALQPDEDAAPPPEADAAAQAASANAETVRVANTGGIGAVLRAEPPRGQQIGSLRDGASLQVLERRDVDGEEWVRVRAGPNQEGWVYGRLVAAP